MSPARSKAKSALAKLDEIEAEMKRIGFWSEDPPDLLADYQAGTRQSYLDAPTFELWLQCVFLVNAREAALANALPAGSQVGEMARRQYDYHEVVPEAEKLLKLLHQFDRIITGRSR
ncbi:MAG: YqcC family protein [Planctomycetes bacterium]|nr:YqcC family protein [Planctomycetota bacterium]